MKFTKEQLRYLIARGNYREGHEWWEDVFATGDTETTPDERTVTAELARQVLESLDDCDCDDCT